jgi:hypothetical protein
MPPHISFEGKIAIALALLALLGTGAIMIAPQQMWIGWTLVAVAVVGFVLLGIHHISSVVAPRPLLCLNDGGLR